jgi:acetyl esterase
MADLDPEIAAVLERISMLGGPPVQERLADARADHDAISVWASGPGQEVARVEDRAAPGPDGPIPVRVYWPAGSSPPGGPGAPRDADPHGVHDPARTVSTAGPLPVIAYFHGGGWVMGSIESFDCVCRALANAAEAIVVNVGYRLAPEHPFPAAAEDASAALAWIGAHAGELGGDPERLAVAGDSAGANLATVAARHAAEDGGPRVGFQALVYPVADCHRTDEDEGMRWMWAKYLGEGTEHDGDPDAVPLRARLAGLPPTLLLCADQDPLRPDGEAYAGALREAGVEVEHRVVPGTTHGFWRWLAVCGVARRTVDEVGAAVRDALA